LLGAFAKLRKATISFVMSVRLSGHPSVWNNSTPTGRIFMKFDMTMLSKICKENLSLIKVLQE